MGRWVATALFNHLLGQRAYLIDKMTNARHRGGHVSVWVPLLAQVQVAIEAVESAMKEALTPGSVSALTTLRLLRLPFPREAVRLGHLVRRHALLDKVAVQCPEVLS